MEVNKVDKVALEHSLITTNDSLRSAFLSFNISTSAEPNEETKICKSGMWQSARWHYMCKLKKEKKETNKKGLISNILVVK